jgi:hypothetical protein
MSGKNRAHQIDLLKDCVTHRHDLPECTDMLEAVADQDGTANGYENG